jgi:hypothetical protein
MLEIERTLLVQNKPNLDYELNHPQGEVGQWLRKRGHMMMMAAKAQVPKGTGKLRASIKMIHSRASYGQYIEIGSNLDYAFYVHEGTRPHQIVPEKAKVLRFSGGGRVIYTHKVDHPGTRANKYLSDQLWMVRV